LQQWGESDNRDDLADLEQDVARHGAQPV